ncbi:MAG: response regulator transcription factor [Acidimicrobiales bacterium]
MTTPGRHRILLVEDDDRIRASLRLAMRDEGYDVLEAPSAEAALDVMADERPELLLVDVMLPGMSGLDLIRRVRRTSAIPIVIVTARDDSHDVVAGLECGADDYVTKPYNVKELAARIRSLLRRVDGMFDTGDAPMELTFDELAIGIEAGTVSHRGQRIDLTTTEFKLLSELASSPKRVLSREDLLSRVWGYDYYGDLRVVDAHVARLRSKLDAAAGLKDWIVTVRGLGYKFDPDQA